MKKLSLVLFLFLFTLAVQAETVYITEFGAVPNDNLDDTPAVLAAIEKLQNVGGGTMVFPSGTTDIKGEVPFIAYGNYLSYRLTGDGGAFIRLNGGPDTDYFKFGNVNQVEIYGLIFYAPFDQVMNARTVIQSGYTSQTNITNCSFFGIGASDSIIDAHNTDLIVEKSQFDGSAASKGVISSTTSRGITVKNSSFIDYAHFLDLYLSKTPHILTPAWINIDSTEPQFGANGQRPVRIHDSRFDEGAIRAVKIRNQKIVDISGISVNVSGVDGSSGVSLEYVEYAEVKFSTFGYSPWPRPAIEIKNKTTVEVTALNFTNAIYFIQKDKSSFFTVKSCAACTLDAMRTVKAK